MLNNARADAQGALLGCDASVAAEHAAEMAEVGETAASGGLGDTSAAFEHGDRSVEPDARQAGMYRAAVERNALGIPAFGHVQWTPEMLVALGTDSDAALAKRWGMSKASVVAKRKELGIACTSEQQGGAFDWTPEAVALLGTASDAKVAEQLGLSRLTVYNARMARGIPAAGRSKAAAPDSGQLTSRTDT